MILLNSPFRHNRSIEASEIIDENDEYVSGMEPTPDLRDPRKLKTLSKMSMTGTLNTPSTKLHLF